MGSCGANRLGLDLDDTGGGLDGSDVVLDCADDPPGVFVKTLPVLLVTQHAKLLSDRLKQLVALEDSWQATQKSLTHKPRKLTL